MMAGRSHRATNAYKMGKPSLPLIEGDAGEPEVLATEVLYANLGGTGKMENPILPTLTPERAERYAQSNLDNGAVFSDLADVDLIFGCDILTAKGLAVKVLSGGRTIYTSADLSGTGYARDAAGNRLDDLRPTLAADGFSGPYDDGDFSEGGL